MTRGKRVTQDQNLPDGSLVLWSQRFESKGRCYVPVRCGNRGQERTVAASGVHNNFTGLCRQCSLIAKRTLVETGEQVLPNGSVIYWDDERYDERYPTWNTTMSVTGRRRLPKMSPVYWVC